MFTLLLSVPVMPVLHQMGPMPYHAMHVAQYRNIPRHIADCQHEQNTGHIPDNTMQTWCAGLDCCIAQCEWCNLQQLQQLGLGSAGLTAATHLHDADITTIALQLHVDLPIPGLDSIHHLPIVNSIPNVIAKRCTDLEDFVPWLHNEGA